MLRRPVESALDPDKVPSTGTTLTVPAGANTQAGDTLHVYWDGDGVSDDWPFPIGSNQAGRPVPFPISKALVDGNLNADVIARYELMRDGQMRHSEQLAFRVGAVSLDLPVPTIDEAPNGTLDPAAARDSLTAIVNYPDSQPTDEVQVTWAGNGEAGSTESEWMTVGSVPLSVPLDNKVVVFNLGATVTVRYEVRRNGAVVGTSDELTLPVSDFDISPGGPLPVPILKDHPGEELDIGEIEGAGIVQVVPPWPLIAIDQRFWLDLEGEKADGSPHVYAQANGVSVTAQHVANGLPNRRVPAAYFTELGDGTELKLVFRVAFDGGNAKADAVTFPQRVYTVRAFEEVTPTIDSVVDDKGNNIPNGGTTNSTSVTLSGKATANRSVEILDGEAPVGNAEVGPQGSWTQAITGLDVRTHRFTARANYGSRPVSEAHSVGIVKGCYEDFSSFAIGTRIINTDLEAPSGLRLRRYIERAPEAVTEINIGGHGRPAALASCRVGSAIIWYGIELSASNSCPLRGNINIIGRTRGHITADGLALLFLDANARPIGANKIISRDAAGWTPFSRKFQIPAGTVSIRFYHASTPSSSSAFEIYSVEWGADT
ncbi:hypothetical protein WT27_02260 [Burkholderia territorii]|uniref:Bacterial Ig-like domain-containing protein n=2 Tax=Burkholderia territorii TaxID=1503055 RepID=A0A119AUT7_9BURK|nr:hypothetical protein WT27_02260 [Burkholderia territorii]